MTVPTVVPTLVGGTTVPCPVFLSPLIRGAVVIAPCVVGNMQVVGLILLLGCRDRTRCYVRGSSGTPRLTLPPDMVVGTCYVGLLTDLRILC